MRLGSLVHDTWWPARFGKVVKVYNTTVHVLWDCGRVWVYDKPHMKFLVEHNEKAKLGRANSQRTAQV